MKRIMLFMMLMLGVVSAVMAQGTDVPATDYDAMIGTFAGFAAGVVVLTEGLKGLFPNMKGWVTQLVSWCVGLVCVMLLWWLDAGFVSDVSWDIALLSSKRSGYRSFVSSHQTTGIHSCKCSNSHQRITASYGSLNIPTHRTVWS